MAVRALVFDFDGTILDTETPEFLGWCGIYERHGVSLEPAAWGAGVGTWDAFDPVAHLEGRCGARLDGAALRAEHRAGVLAAIELERPLPGVVELLEEARAAGLGLAVASSSDRAWVTRWLERHGLLGAFSCLSTRDDVVRVKPDPELYLRALECLGLPAGDCAAVEDSPNGMRAALTAGLRVVAVPNPVTRDLPRPDGVVLVPTLAGVSLAGLTARLEAAGADPGRAGSNDAPSA